MLDNECIFCKIISGEIPSNKVFENDQVLAFLDIMPFSKGHTIVIPKDHYGNFLEFDDKKMAAFFSSLKNIANLIKTKLKADGFNIMQNNFKAAGQVVNHMHFHIIPRWENDGLLKNLDSTKIKAKPEQLNELQKLIKS